MKKEETYLEVYPAWAWSLLTFFISIILLFIIDNQRGFVEIIGYIFYFTFFAIACFYICRAHPESVWYTPIICNLLGVVAIIAVVFTDLSDLSDLIFYIGSFGVSVAGAIIGSQMGRKKTNQA